MTRDRLTTIAACALWILCGLYASLFAYRGWIAHDEGTIGQSAERVLAGEVPHRDFDEVYTGGLTYLHAAGMKILGVNLRTPRLIVFAFFMAFLAAVYSIGRRVSTPVGGLIAMAMAAVWSLPNYFVGLPSWYNLFFATFGILAFLQYLETGHRRWLAIAGACGGFSVLAKITGIYYLAGGLLFLTYLEQNHATGTLMNRPGRSAFWLIVAIPVFVFLVLASRAVQASNGAAVTLFLPAAAVAVFVVWREWASGTGALVDRAPRVFSLMWPFAAGAALPVLAYVSYSWSLNAVNELSRGVFVLPQRRLVEASMNSPGLVAIGLGVPYVVLLLAGWQRAALRDGVVAAILAGVLGVAIMFGENPPLYRVIWAAARAMPLAAVIVGIFIVAHRSPNTAAPIARTRVFLVVTMAAMVALVQFPYATPVYFSYCAPVTVLALVAAVYAQPRPPKRSHLIVATFFFLFAVVFVNPSYSWNLGVKFLPYNPSSRLDLPRGGLRVPDEDKQTYEEVVHLLQRHAAGGTIYAGPDCPEIYFLAGFPNRTRMIFDFLTPVSQDERSMAHLLSDRSIKAAVVNTAPLFSPALDSNVLELLENRFPSFQRVGRFVVRFQ